MTQNKELLEMQAIGRQVRGQTYAIIEKRIAEITEKECRQEVDRFWNIKTLKRSKVYNKDIEEAKNRLINQIKDLETNKSHDRYNQLSIAKQQSKLQSN